MTSESYAQLEPFQLTAEDRQSILIIDDDRDQAEVLSIRLGNLGFEILTAETGGSGLELARQQRPKLVLLDIGLPDVDGFSVCQQLADDRQTCEIPVIIVSGLERSDVVRNSRLAGCRYFLRKPYDPNTLLVLIETALRDPDLW